MCLADVADRDVRQARQRSVRLDDHRLVEAVHAPVVDLERPVELGRLGAERDVQEVRRQRRDPVEVREGALHARDARLHLGRRLDHPEVELRGLVIGQRVEERFERVLAREEVLPRLLVAREEAARDYAREM